MTFASRQGAGRLLGTHLKDLDVPVDLVVGLPRGGVVVAAEVARILRCPLEVLVVRKIGHPAQREFAVGAMAEGGVVVLDEKIVGPDARLRARLDEVIREEEERLRRYLQEFHGNRTLDILGKAVMIVDDGLATGASAEAAVLSARNQGAHEIIVAVPVASTDAIGRLKQVSDDVITLIADPDFDAVGRYYAEFSQTSDEEVLELLRICQQRAGSE